MNRGSILPYLFTFSFSTVFVQALMIGFETSGMLGVFIGGAIAYIPLGFVAGVIWSPRLLIASVLAEIPTLLFVFALHQWSIITTLGTTVEGVPIILEPVSVSLFFFIGAWLGNKAFVLRKRFSNFSFSIFKTELKSAKENRRDAKARRLFVRMYELIEDAIKRIVLSECFASLQLRGYIFPFVEGGALCRMNKNRFGKRCRELSPQSRHSSRPWAGFLLC